MHVCSSQIRGQKQRILRLSLSLTRRRLSSTKMRGRRRDILRTDGGERDYWRAGERKEKWQICCAITPSCTSPYAVLSLQSLLCHTFVFPSLPHFPGRPLVQLVLFFPPFFECTQTRGGHSLPLLRQRAHHRERESHHWSGLGWMQTHIEGGVRAFNQRFSVCLTVGHILCPRRRRASPPIPERKEALLSVCQLPALVLAEGGEGEKRTLGIFIPERKEVPFVCDPSLP